MTVLHMFKISAHSACGSYFQPYLQSVTVIAEGEDQAKERVKRWLEQNDEEFVVPESKWIIRDLGPLCEGVVDYHSDTDY